MLESEPHTFSAQIGVGDNRHLQLSADFGQLTPLQSAALAALAPDFATDAAFGLTFPQGRGRADGAERDGDGARRREPRVSAGWQGGVLEFDKIGGTLGGAELDGKLTVFGTLAKPEMFGDGTVRLASADAPALNARARCAGGAGPAARRDPAVRAGDPRRCSSRRRAATAGRRSRRTAMLRERS